jgi:hypothetical protein
VCSSDLESEADASQTAVAAALGMRDGGPRGPSGSGSRISRLRGGQMVVMGVLALLSAMVVGWRRLRVARIGAAARDASALVRESPAGPWRVARSRCDPGNTMTPLRRGHERSGARGVAARLPAVWRGVAGGDDHAEVALHRPGA